MTAIKLPSIWDCIKLLYPVGFVALAVACPTGGNWYKSIWVDHYWVIVSVTWTGKSWLAGQLMVRSHKLTCRCQDAQDTCRGPTLACDQRYRCPEHSRTSRTQWTRCRCRAGACRVYGRCRTACAVLVTNRRSACRGHTCTSVQMSTAPPRNLGNMTLP